jgi:hypothetical protein
LLFSFTDGRSRLRAIDNARCGASLFTIKVGIVPLGSSAVIAVIFVWLDPTGSSFHPPQYEFTRMYFGARSGQSGCFTDRPTKQISPVRLQMDK